MHERPLDPALTFGNFVVGPSNRRAYGEVVAVATRVGGADPLFLYGGTGVGKTHLLIALAQVRKQDAGFRVAFLHADDLLEQIVAAVRAQTVDRLLDELGALNALVVDDVQAFTGRMESQRVLLRIMETLRRQRCQLVAAGDRRPDAIFGLYRLPDRLAEGRVIELAAPDTATALRIVVRQARRHLVRLPHHLAVVIAESVGASVRELQGAVNRIVAYATLGGREITAELVHDVLAAFKVEPAGADAAAPALIVPPPAAPPAPPRPRGPVDAARALLPRWRRPRRSRAAKAPGDLAAGIAELVEFIHDVGADRIGEPEINGRVIYVPMLARSDERFILRITVGDYLAAPPACTFVDDAYEETPTAWPANEVDGPFRSPDFICTPPTKEFFAYHTERTYRYGDGSLAKTVGTIYAALAAHGGHRYGTRGARRRNVAGF